MILQAIQFLFYFFWGVFSKSDEFSTSRFFDRPWRVSSPKSSWQSPAPLCQEVSLITASSIVSSMTSLVSTLQSKRASLNAAWTRLEGEMPRSTGRLRRKVPRRSKCDKMDDISMDSLVLLQDMGLIAQGRDFVSGSRHFIIRSYLVLCFVISPRFCPLPTERNFYLTFYSF